MVVLDVQCPIHRDSRLLEANEEFFLRQSLAVSKVTRKVRPVAFAGSLWEVPVVPLVSVIELTDDCDLSCSTCIAGSYSGAGNFRTKEELQRMIRIAARTAGTDSTIMLSGGEPTMHPDLEWTVDICYEVGFTHVALVTNGLRLVRDPDFAFELFRRFPNLEIFLQFDSLDPDILRSFRGHDLSDLRRQCLRLLEEREAPTTLVCIVAHGRSLDLLSETIELAFDSPIVRGVNLQPLRQSGRGGAVNDSPTQSAIVQRLADTLSFASTSHFIPHPASPWMSTVGMWAKPTGLPITAEVYETGEHPEHFYPDVRQLSQGYLRVTIVNYLDVQNLRSETTRFDCIGVVTREGMTMPLDLHYMFGDAAAGTPVELGNR